MCLCMIFVAASRDVVAGFAKGFDEGWLTEEKAFSKPPTATDGAINTRHLEEEILQSHERTMGWRG